MHPDNIAFNKRLIDVFRDISNQFMTVMSEFFYEITSDDLDKQVDVVMSAYHEIGGGHQPIYNKEMRKKLIKNSKYPMRKPDEKGVNRKDIQERNNRFDIVYKEMMAKIPNDQKASYIHSIMTRQTDIAATLKMYIHITGSSKMYVDQCINKNIKIKQTGFTKLLNDAIDQRNAYIGHVTEETVEQFTVTDFKNGIQSYLKVIDCLKENNIERIKTDFIKDGKYWIQCVDLSPVSNEQLKQEYPNIPNPIETVKLTELSKDTFGDKVYFHTLTSIKNLIQNITNAFAIAFQNDEKTKPVENHIVFQNALHTAESSILHIMESYQNNAFSGSQLNQIAENTVVMADAKFWMSKFYQKMLSHNLKDLLQKYNRKIVVDKGTRVEIYKVMKNVSGNEKAEDIQNAKWAYNMMSIMHERGYLNYLGTEGIYYGSDENIIDLAHRHPDVTFSVFVNDNHLCELIQNSETTNVLPIKYLHIQDKYIVPKLFYEYYQDTLYVEDEDDTVLEVVESTINEPEITFAGDVSELPKENDYVYDDNNEKIQLKKELGRGGEGTVYTCSQAEKVIKVYHKNCLTEERFQKIQLMVNNQPNIQELCWPEKLIYNASHEFIGYMMKNVGAYKEFGITVLKLDSLRVRQNTMAGWNRLSLVKLCLNLCNVFQKMHEKDIYMGDINPRNMMIIPNTYNNPKFMFVDCDSYQYHDYPCPVGTTPYTSPKLFKRYNKTPDTLEFGKVMRNEDDEGYAIASLLFGILMLKASPFQGKGVTNVNEAMMQYNFAYRTKNSSGKDTIDGPQRMIWNNTPAFIKAKFEKVFANGGYVSLQDWIKVMYGYRKAIENGEYTDEIEPVLYRDGTDAQGQPYNQYFECAECGERRNMPVRRYMTEEKFHQPHLCNRCYPTVNRLRNIQVNHVCSRCGRTFQTSGFEQYRAIKMNDGRMRCKQCKEQRG